MHAEAEHGKIASDDAEATLEEVDALKEEDDEAALSEEESHNLVAMLSRKHTPPVRRRSRRRVLCAWGGWYLDAAAGHKCGSTCGTGSVTLTSRVVTEPVNPSWGQGCHKFSAINRPTDCTHRRRRRNG